MEHVSDDAGVGMAGFHGHQRDLAQAMRVFRVAPKFELRYYSHLVAKIKERSIAVCRQNSVRQQTQADGVETWMDAYDINQGP